MLWRRVAGLGSERFAWCAALSLCGESAVAEQLRQVVAHTNDTIIAVEAVSLAARHGVQQLDGRPGKCALLGEGGAGMRLQR